MKSKRPASFEGGGPLRKALNLAMPVRTAATATMGSATASTVRSCSTAAGMRGRAAAIAAARSRVRAARRRVRARLRRIAAIVGRRVPLWRVRAAAASIGAAIGRRACAGPRRAIIRARGRGVVGRIVGASEAIRSLAMISRIALRAPTARVVRSSGCRTALRLIVLLRSSSAVVCSASAQSVGIHRMHGNVRSACARRGTRHDGAVLHRTWRTADIASGARGT